MPTQKRYNAGETGITAANLNKTGYTNLAVIEKATPDMQVYVNEGVFSINGAEIKFAGGNSGTMTAPSTNPRIDLVCINSSGTLSITNGVEGASPAVPAYPKDKLVLAEIYHRTGTTKIYGEDQGSHSYIYRDSRTICNVNSDIGILLGGTSSDADQLHTHTNLSTRYSTQSLGSISSTSYADLDLSAYVGATTRIVMLYCTTGSASYQGGVSVKTKGDTNSVSGGTGYYLAAQATGQSGFVICKTNSSGVIEIKSLNSNIATSVSLAAYW